MAIGAGINGSFLAAIKDFHGNYIAARTSDMGNSWNLSAPIQTNSDFNYIEERASGKLIIFDFDGNCHHSEDDGVSWKTVQATNQPRSISAFSIADSLTLYAGASGTISVSSNGGASWKNYNTPSPSTVVTGICPSYNGAILAIFDTVSLMRSTDGGFSWNPWGDGIPQFTKLTGMVRDADSGVYISTNYGVYYQPLGGKTWYEATVGLTDFNDLGIISRYGKTLFVIGTHAQIFRAENITKSVKSSTHDVQNTISIFPNPVSSSATISFSLSHHEFIKLELIDQLGRVIRMIRNGNEDAGAKSISVFLGDLPAGMYYVKLQTDDGAFFDKVILQK